MFHGTQMRGAGGGFSHKAPASSTDMRCYFECSETFKKDCDLRLHLKLRHKDEDEEELRRAYQDAEEEIALVSRSASTYQCALCPRKFNNIGSMYDHIRKGHNMAWLEYKDQYGRCEVESAPFECKICGRVVKYIRDSVDKHLKNCHGIRWPQYIDRIRKMRNGQAPEELPNISFFECKICSSSVKYIFRKDHLKTSHKITEIEYIELYKEELKMNQTPVNVAQPNHDPQSYNAPQHTMQPMQPVDDKSQIPMYNDDKSQIPLYNDDKSQIPLYNNDQPQIPNNHNNQSQLQDYNNDQPQVPDFNNDQPQMSDYNNNQSQAIISSLIEQTPKPKMGLPKPPKSAIQDKTNTFCASCNEKFPTRRLFVEHCTTAHDMKFRTVSGATITASTVATPRTLPN